MGAIGYWLFGYAFAFGEAGNAFIGYQYFALADLPVNKYSHWVFHFVFAATAATIVSGAMAERTEFRAYLAYSCFLSGNKKRKQFVDENGGRVGGKTCGGWGGRELFRRRPVVW